MICSTPGQCCTIHVYGFIFSSINACAFIRNFLRLHLLLPLLLLFAENANNQSNTPQSSDCLRSRILLSTVTRSKHNIVTNEHQSSLRTFVCRLLTLRSRIALPTKRNVRMCTCREAVARRRRQHVKVIEFVSL